jgi:predicted GNAT family acetyltransferase
MTDSTDQRASSASDEIQITDNPGRNRYEARVGDRVLGIVDYTVRPDGGLVLDHTEVFPGSEGKGVGTSLARGVLEDVRARGIKPKIACPFISAYVRRHRDEYADLVDR